MSKPKRLISEVKTPLGSVGIFSTEEKRFSCWFTVNQDTVNNRVAGQPITKAEGKGLELFDSPKQAEKFLKELPEPIFVRSTHITPDMRIKRTLHSQNFIIPEYLNFLA